MNLTQVSTLDVQDFLLTPTIIGIAERYFSDILFRTRFTHNLQDAIEYYELILSEEEVITLERGLHLLASSELDLTVYMDAAVSWC